MADENHSAIPGGVQVRDGTKAGHQRLELEFAFADRDVVATPTPGTIWISVGTSVGPGLVNFRAPRSSAHGACERVLRLQGEIFGHVFARYSASPIASQGSGAVRVKVVLPNDWKPDDAAAAWLVKRLLEDGQLPPHARALASHMSRSRRSPAEVLRPRESLTSIATIDGARFLSTLDEFAARAERGQLGANEAPPPVPLFTAMLCHFQKRSGERPPSGHRQAQRDSELAWLRVTLHEMMGIVDHAHASLDAGVHATSGGKGSLGFADAPATLTWRDFDMWRAPRWATGAFAYLLDDVRRALHQHAVPDAGACARTTISLPANDNISKCAAQLLQITTASAQPDAPSPYFMAMALSGGLGPERLGALISPAPLVVLSSQLRKDGMWRHDVFLTPIAVPADEVAGKGPRATLIPSLRGLGLELERCEQEAYAKRQSDDLHPESADPRRGSSSRYDDIPDIDDPWYDGRDHDYLIVSSPYVGSTLPPEDVAKAISSTFWLPKVAKRSGPARSGFSLHGRFTVSRARLTEGCGTPMRSGATAEPTGGQAQDRRVFRPRAVVPTGGGTFHIRYTADVGGSSRDAQDFCLRVAQETSTSEGGQSAAHHDENLRADPDAFAGSERESESFWIVLLRPDPPPLRTARSPKPTISESVPAHVRRELARRVCHPRRTVVKFGRECVADVGPEGIVLWDLEGKFLESKHNPPSEPLPRAVLACADTLAHEWQLRALAEELDSRRAQHSSEAASEILERFVDIAREYRPERVNAGLRRLCAAIDKSRAVPSLLTRLERVLKFTDERERLREDKSRRNRASILNIALLLLALLALVGIPAELIQAASSWPDSGKLEGLNLLAFLVNDAAGNWIFRSVLLLLCGLFVIGIGAMGIWWSLGYLHRASPATRRLIERLTSTWRRIWAWPPPEGPSGTRVTQKSR